MTGDLQLKGVGTYRLSDCKMLYKYINYTVDFTGRECMYNDFVRSDAYLTNKDKWSISGNYKLTLTF